MYFEPTRENVGLAERSFELSALQQPISSSKGLFSASGAIECRLREALRVKTWCRGSQNVCTHLSRGRGNYGCHRSRPRWGSLTDRFQSQSRVLAIAVGPKLLVTIEQTQNLLLGFSQKVVNHVPVTSRAHGATTCLSRTIMCHTLLHNNSYLPISSTKIVLENRPKTAQIPLTIIVFYRNKRFGALEPPSVRCSCHVL